MRMVARPLAAFAGFIALALLVYGGSLSNDFVIWDDDSLITDNPIVAEFTPATVRMAFTTYDPELYIPLSLVTFQIEKALFGYNPFYYHLDNVILHALNATLLFFLFGALGFRSKVAAFLAALFLVHPLNTEAAIWASARKDVLCTFFLLSSILAFIRWRQDGRSRVYAIAVLCALLAMLSKALAIMIPAGLLLLDVLMRHRFRRDDIVRYTPFVLLSILFFIIGILGKTENIGALTMIETGLLAVKAIAGYFPKFLWPAWLSILYPQLTPITPLSVEFFVPILVCITMIFLIVRFRNTALWLSVGLAWYVIFLLPSFSNFAKSGDLYVMSDRYPYVAQVGLLLILGNLLMMFSRRITIRIPVAIAAASTIVIALGFAAQMRSKVWASSEILFRDALAKNDTSVVMHYNLGVVAFYRGYLEEADKEYRRAIALQPTYVDAYRGLARLAKDRGDRPEAVRMLQKAVLIDASDPEMLRDLGVLLIDEGAYAEAVTHLERAITIAPSYADAHADLGAAYGKLERYEEAIVELKKAQMLRGH